MGRHLPKWGYHGHRVTQWFGVWFYDVFLCSTIEIGWWPPMRFFLSGGKQATTEASKVKQTWQTLPTTCCFKTGDDGDAHKMAIWVGKQGALTYYYIWLIQIWDTLIFTRIVSWKSNGPPKHFLAQNTNPALVGGNYQPWTRNFGRLEPP